MPSIPARLAIGLVRFYKVCISPMLPQACIYEPTCSEYMRIAIERKGFVRGMLRGLWRLCRCHPWARGGWDPVDPTDEPTYLGKTCLPEEPPRP